MSSNTESDWPIVGNIGTLDVDKVNTVIDALEKRTDNLYSQLQGLTGSCGLTFTAKGISSDCKKGMMLAYDPKKGTYIPAVPAYDGVVRADGSLAPAASSYVAGVLVSDISNGIGTIMANGWTSDTALIADIVGNSASSGLYYLSETDPGRLVEGGSNTTVNIPVYCCTLVRSTKPSQNILIVNPKSPEYTGHSHGSVALTDEDAWSIANDKSSYTSSATEFVSLINSYNGHNLTLTNNGSIVTPGTWSVNVEEQTVNLTTKKNAEDYYVLHGIIALQGKDPLVHSVEVSSKNALISTNNAYGNVLISTDFKAKGNNVYSGHAISDIDETAGVQKCPVVHSIQAGPGIVLSNEINEANQPVTNSFVISSSAICKNQIDMQISNLDGVLFGTDKDKVCYLFPSGVESALYGSFRIPHFESGDFKAQLNLLIKGTGESVPAFAVKITKIPMPTSAAPTEGISPDSISTSGVSSTTLGAFYKDSANLGVVTSDAVLTCKLSISPAVSIELIAASIELVPYIEASAQ